MQTNLIILYGPPGSGKGTQANLLSKKLGIKFLDAGHEFREFALIHANEPNNPEAERSSRVHEYLNKGTPILTQDYLHIIQKQVENAIASHKPLIMDKPGGSLIPEAEWLNQLILDKNIKVKFFHLPIPLEESIRRIEARYFVPGYQTPYATYKEALAHCVGSVKPIKREDDTNDELIKSRYQKVYSNQAEQILQIFGSNPNVEIVEIDASQPVDIVHKQILDNIN